MYEQDQLVAAGRAAAKALATQSDWVHRRVERISFPSPDEPVYRRHVSVDFTIPRELQPVHPSGEETRFYVPLSLLLKWPPLLRLDLRDGSGAPIPFLTGTQNAILDAAALTALAESAAADELTTEVKEAIRAVTDDRSAADHALRFLLPSPAEVKALGEKGLDPLRRQLREDPIFVGAAGGLRDSTFLWLRVAGHPGDREIVKFSYDIPMEVEVGKWGAASFGLRAFIADFASPHIGSSSSYHLTITAPAPIRVVDSAIWLRRDPQIDTEDGEQGKLLTECTAATSPKKDSDLILYTEPVGDQGRFYLTGPRTGCHGIARVALISDKSFVRNAALAATLIASLVTAYADRLSEVLELSEAAVTLALVAPALLAYLLVRPAQHEFARSFTTGTRRTLALSGLLPILGAASIVLSGGKQSGALCEVFCGIAISAWILALLLGLAAILPVGKRAKPLSSYSGDNPGIEQPS